MATVPFQIRALWRGWPRRPGVTNGELGELLARARPDDVTVLVGADGRRYLVESAELYPGGAVRLHQGELIP